MQFHPTLILSLLWQPGDWVKSVTGLDKLEDIYDKLSNFEKLVIGYLQRLGSDIGSSLQTIKSIGSSITSQTAEISKYMPSLDKIKEFSLSSKNALDSIKSMTTTMSSNIGSVETHLEKIKEYTGDLPDITSEISATGEKLESIKTFMSDMKTKIAEYLPKLGKLEKLEDLETRLTEIGSTISSLEFKIPENLQVDFDDSKIVEELTKTRKSVLDMADKFGSLDTKLDVLNSINENLINQLTLQEYTTNLVTQNISIFQPAIEFINRLSEVNNLGFQLLKLDVGLDEYVTKFSDLMTKTYSLSIPSIPGITIHRPEPISKNGLKTIEDFLKQKIPEDMTIIDPGLTDEFDLRIDPKLIDSGTGMIEPGSGGPGTGGVGAYLEGSDIIVVGSGSEDLIPIPESGTLLTPGSTPESGGSSILVSDVTPGLTIPDSKLIEID